MSQVDILEALRSLGGPRRPAEIRAWLQSNRPRLSPSVDGRMLRALVRSGEVREAGKVPVPCGNGAFALATCWEAVA
jgi:hypothetical protein